MALSEPGLLGGLGGAVCLAECCTVGLAPLRCAVMMVCLILFDLNGENGDTMKAAFTGFL